MLRTLLVTALLLPFAFGHAAAHGCPSHDDAALALGGVYVTEDHALFVESNSVAGLQRSAGSCEDENGRTRSWVPDTSVL